MKINENGKCPICLVKPLTYKRYGVFFCVKCNREFNIETGCWQKNWAWSKENEKSELSKKAELAVKTGKPQL